MRILLLLLFFFTAILVKSQTRNSKSTFNDTLFVNEVIVTGTTTKIHKNYTPLAISVVNRRQISEGNESALLPMLNGRVPGLFVTERGVTGFGVATGAAGQISIRGIGGSPTTGVLILIDGHPQFMGLMGHPLPDSYVASDVEQVEVIRGPASTLYGSNAMGGVINIITRKQNKEGLNGNARLMYGSFNTQKQMGSTGYKNGKFSIFASANHDKTEGHRPNSDFEITNGYAKADYEINDKWIVKGDLSLARFNAKDPGPDTLKAIAGNAMNINRGYYSFSLDNEYYKTSGSLKIYNNFGEHTLSDGFHSTDMNRGVNFFQTLKLFSGNTISLGADYANYGGRAENTKAMNGRGILLGDTTINEKAMYGFVQQTILENFTVSGGIRWQNHSSYGSEWIPTAGFAWQMPAAFTWKGSVSKGFRSPTIRELYLFNHNPDLKPERIICYETGLSRSFLNRLVTVELTGYHIQGDNLIVTGAMGKLYNTGKIKNNGIEVALGLHPGQHFDGLVSYSYIDMENPVYATPKHNLFISGTWIIQKWRFNGSLQYVNNLDNDVSNTVNFENYTLLNAKVTYSITPFLEFSVNGENLLNQNYAPIRYYPMPGTTIFASLSLQLGKKVRY